MSFWRKLFGGREPAPEPRDEPAADDAAADEGPVDPSRPSEPAPIPDDPELRLEQLGEQPQPSLDDDEVLELIERLRVQGREARAIALARRVLSQHPDRLPIHQRVAEMLASRGDDEGALRLIEPFVDRLKAPLELWMLAAEIAERRGDRTRALALYERVVARDLDYPRARSRVRRLREGERHQQDLGATLMADGALTRGRYRVQRELGRGGAGTVFLAEDLQLGRPVALKVYHRRGRAERVRLLVEARTAARFEHPGIVRVFDLDETLAAIAMERVTGGSVRGELSKGGLTAARLERWFATAAEALARVHQDGFVHRDFKPSNMLLREDDRVVLTDFGVAVVAGAEGPAAGALGEGTLAYMAPEQRAGAPADPRMDIHALGVSIREALQHVAAEPPERLVEVAGACVRQDPAARPTAAWIAQALGA